MIIDYTWGNVYGVPITRKNKLMKLEKQQQLWFDGHIHVIMRKIDD